MRSAWGKREAEGLEHHLAHHCADVAAAFERLIEEPAIKSRLERAAERLLDPTTKARLSALVFLHDVGKLNSGFQTKWQSPPPLGWVGHVGEGALILAGRQTAARRQVRAALDVEDIASWGAGTMSLLLAGLAHHGRPLDPQATAGSQDNRIWLPIAQYDPVAAARDYSGALKEWFSDAFVDGPDLPDAPAFQHLFAGLVAIADQIASREHLWRAQLDPTYGRCARERMNHAVRAVGFRAAERRDGVRTPTVSEMFAFSELRPIQARLRDASVITPLLILESETGSGKTEAALLRFKRLFEAGDVDALYFAVPTRSAAVQLHRRVHRAAKALFGDGFEAVLAVTGYLTAGEAKGAPIERFDVKWEDDPDQARRDARWAAETPRRFLAAEVAVGTVHLGFDLNVRPVRKPVRCRPAHSRVGVAPPSLLQL